VGGEVGDPELAAAELAPEGVGRADVLHGAPQHPAHPGGRGRRGGVRVLLLLLLPLPRGRGSVGLRRLRRRGLRPVLLGLRAVMLVVVMLRGVGALVVRLGAVAGGAASHGGRSGAGAQSVEWGGAGEEAGKKRRRGRRRRRARHGEWPPSPFGRGGALAFGRGFARGGETGRTGWRPCRPVPSKPRAGACRRPTRRGGAGGVSGGRRRSVVVWITWEWDGRRG
jgi:hypothetical protein